MKRFVAASILLLASVMWMRSASTVATPSIGTTKTASQLGAVLDCNLTTGLSFTGGACTNNTTVLQQYISSASATNPVHLVIDGGAGIKGLKIPAAGYVTIEGRGYDTGFFMIAGSNSSALYSDGAPMVYISTDTEIDAGAPPTRGKNLVLANFRVNGNRGTINGSGTYLQDGNSSATTYQGNSYFAFNFNLANLDHIRIRDIWSENSPAWNLRMSNVGDVVMDGYYAKETYYLNGSSNIWNGDGFDFTGPANDIRVSNCTIETNGDDAIVLDAAGGYGGNISRVTVNGCTINGATSIARIWTTISASQRFTVDNVALSNIVGWTQPNSLCHGIMIGYDQVPGQGTGDWVRHLSISNVSITANDFLFVGKESMGDVTVSNSRWIPTAASPAFKFNPSSTTGVNGIGTLTLNGFEIYRDASGSSAGYLISVPSGATVGTLDLKGVRVANASGGATAALASLIDVPTGGAITRMWVSSLDPVLIAATCDTTNAAGTSGTSPCIYSSAGNTNITKVQGPGVTAAGLTAK